MPRLTVHGAFPTGVSLRSFRRSCGAAKRVCGLVPKAATTDTATSKCWLVPSACDRHCSLAALRNRPRSQGGVGCQATAARQRAATNSTCASSNGRHHERPLPTDVCSIWRRTVRERNDHRLNAVATNPHCTASGKMGTRYVLLQLKLTFCLHL